MSASDTVIIIPARLSAARLPNKPILDINGLPMVIRVANQSALSNVARVVLACGEQEIMDIALQYGYKAILTDPALPSGTDRVCAALQDLGNEIKYIINVQGDLPYIDPETIIQTHKLLIESKADIATAVSMFAEEDHVMAENRNIVKAIIAHDNRALFFTRVKCPSGPGPMYKHIGIYGYTREALERFVSLPVSELEKREGLEQLRALENGMTIYAAVVDDHPVSVDTPDDLEYLRNKHKT